MMAAPWLVWPAVSPPYETQSRELGKRFMGLWEAFDDFRFSAVTHMKVVIPDLMSEPPADPGDLALSQLSQSRRFWRHRGHGMDSRHSPLASLAHEVGNDGLRLAPRLLTEAG